ncbi:MAG: thiamine pyrophosphate-dependent enzyme, partial [Pseudomonadota bacterium]|nr:thiamine pyrophosphate-dependent enzyme [Pseudomonadota bacterium]
ENLPIIFMIWNSQGFQEIETSMRAAGVTVVGCNPTPPDFAATAQSMSVPYTVCKPDPTVVGLVLKQMAAYTGPSIIEVHAPLKAKQPWP